MINFDDHKGKMFLGKKAFEDVCKIKGIPSSCKFIIDGNVTYLLSPLLGDHDAVSMDPEIIDVMKTYKGQNTP